MRGRNFPVEDMVKVQFPKDEVPREAYARMLTELKAMLGAPPAGSIGERPAALGLQEWLLGQDEAALRRGVDALLGMGQGSTPSGDDFLLGCCAMLYSWGKACHPVAFRLMQYVLRRAPEATTALSGTYLAYGAREEFHRIIQRMLIAFAGGLAPLFRHRAKQVMDIGHSSGRDFLTGFLYCGDAILKNRGNGKERGHEGMKIYNVVRKNNYHDSVTLMVISKKLKQIVEGLDDVSVMMGTPANHGILRDANLLGPEGEAAGPNDLILAFRAAGDVDVDAVVAQIDAEMKKKGAAGDAKEIEIHSALTAYKEDPSINMAVISVPGEYAAIEAERALHHGKNVMLFSDNVTVEEEVALKKLAAEKDLLVMGPDCGTAIINGVGLAFSNEVKRGNVGLISASGTGLQEVACLLDQLGIGVSQAIGTGGRDLKEAVGAATMTQALNMMFADSATEAIVLISKPPAASVVEKILVKLRETKKPVVICFIGAAIDAEKLPGNIKVAASLEEAAAKTAEILGKKNILLDAEAANMELAKKEKGKLNGKQKYVRALYTGGTLCYEAMLALNKTFGQVYSNIALDKSLKTSEVMVPHHHSAIDLGDDAFTLGRPHPMIDGSVRDEHILKVAGDPETAVLLIDVVIGYGAAADPAGELVPVLASAKELAQKQGNELVIVGYVCGTEGDAQGKRDQAEKLRKAGAIVASTNAQAVRMAELIAEGRN